MHAPHSACTLSHSPLNACTVLTVACALCVVQVDASIVAPSRRVLHAGEFVEYDGDAARLFSNGGVPEAGWVCGILGFPLMCEVQVAAAAGVAA